MQVPEHNSQPTKAPPAALPACCPAAMWLLLLSAASLLGAVGAAVGAEEAGSSAALPPWLPRNPTCPAHGCPLPVRRSVGTVDTTQYLRPAWSATQNTAGWKALVKVLEGSPGSVAAIPSGVYNVTPLSPASGLVNVTIAGGQQGAPTLFRVHNATGAHVAAWGHSRGLYLRDLSFVAVGVPPCTPLGCSASSSGLNWYNVSDSIVEGVSMVGGRMMSMSGGCPCSSCGCFNPPINFHFRRCYSSNAPVGIFLCNSWYSSIEDSVAENITGSPVSTQRSN